MTTTTYRRSESGLPPHSHGRRRSGVTILELLVFMSSLLALVSLLLPAIWAARETSRNIECTERLHQLGVAIHSYEKSHGALPPGWLMEPTKFSGYAWATAILPQLGEDALDAQINRGRPIFEVSSAVTMTTPAVFLCPSDHGANSFPLFAELGLPGANAQKSTRLLAVLPRANYMGVFGTKEPDEVAGDSGEGVFIEGRGFRLPEITRGLSHVYMVGERTTRKMASTWLGFAVEGEDAGGRVVGAAFEGPNREEIDECEFDSRHFGHVNFAWADGHVSSLKNDIDREVYIQSAQRCDFHARN
jgi:prepilin-type processing-associated H-X9-DG protein